MDTGWKTEVKTLLSQSRIGFLATQGQQGPETSMAPYAIYHGNLLLHLSGLARHTENIKESPAAGFMICTPETMADSPLALPRLSFQGAILPVTEDLHEAAKACYLQHIPDAKPLFSFADFQLFQLTIENIHWVGGFGSARTVPVDTWHKTMAQHHA